MNPFLIGIPGFVILYLASYVLGEIAGKYTDVAQAGKISLGARPLRIRFFTILGISLAGVLVLHFVGDRIWQVIAPWSFFALIALAGWLSLSMWRMVKGVGTSAIHRRYFGASNVCGFLALAIFASACAATGFVPKSWLESKRAGQHEIESEAAFWSVVDKVHLKSGAYGKLSAIYLREELLKHDADDIQAFQRFYDAQIAKSYRWDLWGACYVMNGGCSDDGFRYFRDWLISEGRHTFEAALKSPESLADLPRAARAENESFGSVAYEIYEKKTGAQIAFGATDLGDPAGDEWQEEDLPQMFPRLGEKYLSMQPEDSEPRL